jgi:UTP:GlnB (protein PII) uridylyltransferase
MNQPFPTGESAPSVNAYVLSMPPAYRAAFDEWAIEAHAAIVRRRGSRAAHVEVWRELPERIVALCVVADDSLGLLSRICAALVAHDVDVVAAQAYGRHADDGRNEAVDFLWVRRMPSTSGVVAPLRARDIAAIGDTLEALVGGRATFELAVSFTRAVRAVSPSTRVRFERGEGGELPVLIVEALDHPGLLLTVTGALFRAGVQIVSSRVATEGERATDRFQLAELDGAPLDPQRQLEVQTAVLAAIESSGRQRGG